MASLLTFRACLTDPKTERRLESDAADFKAVHGHPLPLIWINDEIIEGSPGPERLAQAMDKALSEVTR